MSTPLARICVGNEWKTHVLHHRVVNRAVGVLLALALHRPHDLLATVRVTLPLTHISRRYLNELRRIRVQRGVQTVELVETATDDACPAARSGRGRSSPPSADEGTCCCTRRPRRGGRASRVCLARSDCRRGRASASSRCDRNPRSVPSTSIHGEKGTAKDSAAFSTWIEKS